MRRGTLGELDEDRFVERLVRRWPRQSEQLIVGPGDDCAVLPARTGLQLLKTDAIVEGRHFTARDPARWIGWKAVARCVSDIAAMGGTPIAAVIALGVPSSASVARIEQIYRGMEKGSAAFGFALAGGETVASPCLWLAVSMTGHLSRRELVLRSGARVGDQILVTGRLGGSIRGRHLRFIPRLREAQWVVRHHKPTAMMDLSDGLARDLPRLCRASNVSFALEVDRIPRQRGCSTEQALGDGEDFELLLTVPPRKVARLQCEWPFPLELTPIGSIGPSAKANTELKVHGFDHFKKR